MISGFHVLSKALLDVCFEAALLPHFKGALLSVMHILLPQPRTINKVDWKKI